MVLRFRYPLEPPPRIAIAGMPVSAADAGEIAEAETVAAPSIWFRDCPVRSWRPKYPVIAFSSVSCGFLTDEDREEIWRRWGVPVFEQLLSSRMEVVAEECEAHEGLHLVRRRWEVVRGELIIAGEPTGLVAELDHRPCECLNESPRVVNVSARAAAMAAGA